MTLLNLVDDHQIFWKGYWRAQMQSSISKCIAAILFVVV